MDKKVGFNFLWMFSKYGDRVSLYFCNIPVPNGLGVKNIDKLIGWMSWLKKTVRSISDVDIVHACDLDTGRVARKYCKKNRKKLVYDIFDYYIDTHTVPGPLRKLVEKQEIKVINDADATIICTEERREQISLSSPKKICVIHNSPDVDEQISDKAVYDYAYCGSLADMRLISEIFEKYQDNTDLSMIVAGYGKYSQKAEELSSGNEGFEFVGPVTYSEVIKIETEAKVLSAIYEPTIRNHRLCAPNKFYEALALGKPLIVCRGTGIDKVVEQNDIGRVINYDADEFYSALRALTADDTLRSEMGIRARALYEEHYRWSRMKDRLIKLYGEIQ